MAKYCYFLKTESGDDFLIACEKDYPNAIEFMKNEIPSEYEAWKSEGYEDDEIPFETYSKKSI